MMPDAINALNAKKVLLTRLHRVSTPSREMLLFSAVRPIRSPFTTALTDTLSSSASLQVVLSHFSFQQSFVNKSTPEIKSLFSQIRESIA
jgi:hypothetical protein